jgi:hypothetical protein
MNSPREGNSPENRHVGRAPWVVELTLTDLGLDKRIVLAKQGYSMIGLHMRV